jgi:FMN-dependent NADH-azoreductase
MKKILNIVSGIRGAASLSTQLANSVVDRIQAEYPDNEVTVYDLAQNPPPHLGLHHFEAVNIPSEQRTATQAEDAAYSDTAIKDLFAADIIVISIPFYNFGIPSTLKSWIDHISRAGITFTYTEAGPKGLVTGKEVYLAFSAGGVYSAGPMQYLDSAEPYLRNVLGFFGMTDVTTFWLEGNKIPGIAETAWPKAMEQVNEFAF